jgi:hypothetical protein
MAPYWLAGDGRLEETTVWVFATIDRWRLDPVSAPVPFTARIEKAEMLLANP